MKLLDRLRRGNGPDGDDAHSEPRDPGNATPLLDDPMLDESTGADDEGRLHNDGRQSLFGRLRKRIPKSVLPGRMGRHRKRATQDDGGEEDPDNPSAHSLLGDDADTATTDPHSADTLEELLASDMSAHDDAKLLADYRDLEEEEPPQKEQAQPITFDTHRSSVLEPIARLVFVAALVSLCVVSVMGVFAAYKFVKSDGATTVESAATAEGSATATGPSQRAAGLGEEFATAYLAYPSAKDAGSGDYLEKIEPYLHPRADPGLFIPGVADDAAGTEVSYASARSVEAAPGQDRYKVTVDARLLPADTESGGQSTSRVLTARLQVPDSGGGAYVVAPPTVTEASGESGSGQPGIYGYSDAQNVADPHLESTLEDFFEALYGPADDRPLVEEEMVEGTSVANYPPEGHSYEGVERAAIYYRGSAEQLDEAESQGFSALYDLEVYVGVTDEDSSTNRLDSWALTVGEDKEGNFKITSVG